MWRCGEHDNMMPLAPFMGFGFRVSRFGRGGFQDGFRHFGFRVSESVGYKLGFGFRKVRVTSCVGFRVSGRPTIHDVPAFDLSPTSAILVASSLALASLRVFSRDHPLLLLLQLPLWQQSQLPEATLTSLRPTLVLPLQPLTV